MARFAVKTATLGGLAGGLALTFGLVYRFFPGWLHVDTRPIHGAVVPPPAAVVAEKTAPVVDAAHAIASVGPPIALAPEAVRKQRIRKAIMTAMADQPAAPGVDIKALLAQAAKARDAGHWIGAEDAAVALYVKVLRTNHKQAEALDGLVAIDLALLGRAQALLDEGKLDNAMRAIDGLRKIPGSANDVKRLVDRVDAIRQASPKLAEAASLLRRDNHPDAKSVGKALALYREVIAVDPENIVARRGLARIQRGVLAQALDAAALGDFATADNMLGQAGAIYPGSAQWKRASSHLREVQTQLAEGYLGQAGTALAAGNFKLARSLRHKALAITNDIPGLDAFETQFANAKLYDGHAPGEPFHDVFRDRPGQSPTMITVPVGNFMMGSAGPAFGFPANESPWHEVRITRGFAISEHEITVGQYRQFVQASGYVPESANQRGSMVYNGTSGAMRLDRHATWESDFAGHESSADEPVVNVSWTDAEAYVKWLSLRTGEHYALPSEAQFAYALRGGSKTRYWWGDDNPKLLVENVAGSGDRSPGGRSWTNAFPDYADGYWGTAPVGSFKANGFGLYDMDGNVTEWTRDCWHDSYLRAPADGSAWINPGCERRVQRGASWGSPPEMARSAWRRGMRADERSGRVGFRVVREF